MKALPSVYEGTVFIYSINPDKPVYKCFSVMATKQQLCNVRNLEYNNNSTLTTVYDNDNNNQQIYKDSRIGNRILIL